MLRRRTRPPAGPTPRPNPIHVFASRPAPSLALVSADLLPTTSGHRRGGTVIAAPTPTVRPSIRIRPRTADERAAHVLAMARAASIRAATPR